jgi:hypothetical protein
LLKRIDLIAAIAFGEKLGFYTDPHKTNPEYVGFFGSIRVVLHSKRIPYLFQQFFGFVSGIHCNKRPFLRDIM